MSERYLVIDHKGNHLGSASNFKEAKDLHRKNIPSDLLSAYAVIDTSALSKTHIAQPIWYVEFLTPELIDKYNLLDS